MAKLQPSGEKQSVRTSLDVEHRALKDQMVDLRREHERLHEHGGTAAEHTAHKARLRHKTAELEAHMQRLLAANHHE